jgi:hypothetical protein
MEPHSEGVLHAAGYYRSVGQTNWELKRQTHSMIANAVSWRVKEAAGEFLHEHRQAGD